MEEWARGQNASSLVDFSSKDGEVEGIMKDISERATQGKFSYSRFFAVGLFRILELANATEPTILEKVCFRISYIPLYELESVNHVCKYLWIEVFWIPSFVQL